MSGQKKIGHISEPEFADLLQALSATTKGRSFLDEYRRRSRPEETLGLIDSMSAIEKTLGAVRDELQPQTIVNELRHVSMTLDIALDGAAPDPEGDETARRLALVDQARRELETLAATLTALSQSMLGAARAKTGVQREREPD
jgi:hypothetical protein